MKKFLVLCSLCLFSFQLWAQSPALMSYQSVIRDGNDELVKDQMIGMQISILQGSGTGTEVYRETHDRMTNANGLLSIQIGNGSVQSGSIENIDWSSGPYFILTEVDPDGGTNYSIMGASQLLSVPYAMYASESGTPGPAGEDGVGIDTTLDNGDGTFTFVYDDGSTFTTSDLTGPQGPEGPQGIQGPQGTEGPPGDKGPFYLGQDTLGGIVYHVYYGEDGEQHGLIISKTETTAAWQSNASTTGANRSWDGAYNTNQMTNSPAKNWIQSNFGPEWYLPSVDEMNLVWQNRFHINRAMSQGGHTVISYNTYWTSTEESATVAWNFWFSGGGAFTDVNKTNARRVRAVRAF